MKNYELAKYINQSTTFTKRFLPLIQLGHMESKHPSSCHSVSRSHTPHGALR